MTLDVQAAREAKTGFVRKFLERASEQCEGRLRKGGRHQRQITAQTLNRLVFCLNKVEEKEVISLLDLKFDLQRELEGAYTWEIDKRTVKKLVDLLVKCELVKVQKYSVTVEHANGKGVLKYTRLILTAPHISDSD